MNLDKKDLTEGVTTPKEISYALYLHTMWVRYKTGRQISPKNYPKDFFKGADLRYTNLTGADLTGANLEGVDLTKSILNGTNLTNVDLKNVNLFYINKVSDLKYQKFLIREKH